MLAELCVMCSADNKRSKTSVSKSPISSDDWDDDDDEDSDDGASYTADLLGLGKLSCSCCGSATPLKCHHDHVQASRSSLILPTVACQYTVFTKKAACEA